MDTQQITQVLSTNNITKNAYLGTFPCDKLPTKIDRIPFEHRCTHQTRNALDCYLFTIGKGTNRIFRQLWGRTN